LFLTRKLGKIVRGAATLPQILAAGALGGTLGFVPGAFLPGDLGGGFMQAPGLIVLLLGLVLLLDANLAVFGLVMLVAKLLSFALLPLSFAVGRFLLDGPTEGLFRVLVNAPVTAWFGLERYATTGGAACGLVFGLVAGFLLFKALHALRARMATVEEGSERYQKLASKKSVKVLTWVFFGGGRGKKTWREVAESDRKGKVVRPIGIAVVLVLAGLLWFAQGALGGAWLEEQARTGLARWNGATVDLGGATLDLAGGRLAFEGLAMADPEQLDRDTLRARTLELDVATTELLAGRVVVQRLASGEAKSGLKRDEPGVRIDPPVEPPSPPDGPGKTLDDYLADAEVWKERLDQAAEWIEKLTGGGETPADETGEERDARVEFEKDTLGLVHVVATHLIAKRPAVTVRELVFDGMTFAALGDGELVDVRGENLSSQPALAGAPAVLRADARSGLFGVQLSFDPATPSRGAVTFALRGLAVDSLAAGLRDSPIRGGTLDLTFSGGLDLSGDGVEIDLPLVAVLKGTTLSVGGQEATIETLEVPVGVRGPLRNPRIVVDGQQVADALVAAGRGALADQVRARADALLGGAVPGVGDAFGGILDGTKTPGQLLEEAQKKAAEEAQKKAEEEARKKVEEELGKRLPGGVGDIFRKK
jgi:uncharacterized protein (TIGR03546 family)